MQRIYRNQWEIWETTLQINDKEVMHQILKVLRGKVGDECIFFHGRDFYDYKYKITSIDKKNIFFHLQEKISKNPEKIDLYLFQALPNKIDKIEDIIEKWTQRGYSKFIFFESNRSQEIFLSENKLHRFQKIIQESVELSGRNVIPEIIFTQDIELESINWESFYFHTQDNQSHLLRNIDFSQKRYNLFIGPEWGFDESEIQAFDQNNFKRVYLWENILRTQTAAITTWFYFIQSTL